MYIKNIIMTKRQFTEIEKERLLLLWNKIKARREDLKLSQSELAKKSNMDRSYISMVERGETNVTYLKLLQIWDAMNDVFL